MTNFLGLFIGFVLLIKGADLFVEGSSSIARKLKIPAMIIGLTIVAMGTSAPEASVSITSSLAGQNDMSIANVVGSNFFNILVVLGISSIMGELPIEKSSIKKDIPLLIGISILILVFLRDLALSRFEGTLLLIMFVMFLYNLIKSSKDTPIIACSSTDTCITVESISDYDITDNQDKYLSIYKTILISILGIVGIVLGGNLVVTSASNIASIFGMSDNLIGLTIVAVGTSLPELVTSIMAVRKGETEIAIGNVVGSNIFNILLILGLASFISPISISLICIVDIIFMTIITILLYVFAKKDNLLKKYHGLMFLLIYITYMIFTIIR